MASSGKKKTRHVRVTGFELPPGHIAQWLSYLQRGDVLLRLALCVVAATAMWAVSRAWAPPFEYREGFVPPRDITAKVAFRMPDPLATDRLRERMATQSPSVYKQDPKELVLLRAALDHLLAEIVGANSFADLNPEVWKQFALIDPASAPPAGNEPVDFESQEQAFEQFRAGLGGRKGLDEIKAAVQRAFESYERDGLLEKLPEGHGEGNRKEIAVYPIGRLPTEAYLVQVDKVLIGEAAELRKNLIEQIPQEGVALRLFNWLAPRLPATLALDDEATRLRREGAMSDVAPQFTTIEAGAGLAAKGKPLDTETLQLLRTEYDAYLAELPMAPQVERSVAVLGMIAALFVLCGYYIYIRDAQLLADIKQFVILLLLAVAAVATFHWMSGDPWRAELIPLLLFAMTFGIAYDRDLALLLTLALAIFVCLTGGQGLGEFIMVMGVVSAAILQLGRIRSRSKLIAVGFYTALAAFLLTLGTLLLTDQPLNWMTANQAGRNALWAFAAGFLVTGMLPFIERAFGVLTEISLLELGDVSHPLLQELVRRAPGTYNHSINVASIAEAAAESIGARGLLVRVGAYFHDIGKMLKPMYFVENQGMEASRHDSLNPAMSTLIIIAHVKDGAELARQHHVPEPVVDFILQHHGTTLVEYFYHRASQQSEGDPDRGGVMESSYRYPGPKPQTVEAAVLMLSDAVEGACRALVEPTPARIDNLVREIGKKRLLDGQFDECGLTLKQLHTIEGSLIKSLIAVYHGRVKYPSQQTA